MPFPVLLLLCIMIGLAPFSPEPHLVEKIRMLIQGTLKRPIDIFDLFFHSAPLVLLVVKTYSMIATKKRKS
ncbi:RND transporter [Desulfogranum marinum]|uniref:RND transporter n=1 Tax=Desulfogranum marinum TaxID=453220 RepID=UPI0029C6CC76|nr:RND transporter [Desulfogranum marinum]